MKLNKIIFIIILMVLTMFLISTKVHAAESGTINLSLDSASSYTRGGTVIINVDLSVSGFDGVIEFLADVKYDSNVLKYTGINVTENWSVSSKKDVVYIENENMQDSSGRLCQLKFEVLSESPSTTVELANIDASGVSGKIHYLLSNVNTPSITFKTEKGNTLDTPDVPSTSDTPNTSDAPDTPNSQENVQDTKDTPSITDVPNNNKNEHNTSIKGKLPQTGDINLTIIGVVLATLGILIAVLIKYLKFKKENKI